MRKFRGILIFLMVFGLAGESRAIDGRGVVLDRDTFGDSYSALQRIANRLFDEVDHLIPGKMPNFPYMEIRCFIAPDAWQSAASDPPPITLVGPSRPGEPSTVRPYTPRIALSTAVSLPQNESEFIFELAHELAHLKMDARYDNYLVETFAVAVSLKILKTLQYDGPRDEDIALYIKRLPEQIQSSITRNDWKAVTLYWQSEIPRQKSGPVGTWDFSFAMLGAIILEAAEQPTWSSLLGVGELSDGCFLSNGTPANETTPAEFKTCSPSLNRMTRLRPALKALGYSL